jgi:hypothetical protein
MTEVSTPGYRSGMSPNAPKTPVRPIRVEASLWDEFGKAATASDTDRSAALRAFMAWYARRPGAKLPTRPAAVPTTEEASQ